MHPGHHGRLRAAAVVDAVVGRDAVLGGDQRARVAAYRRAAARSAYERWVCTTAGRNALDRAAQGAEAGGQAVLRAEGHLDHRPACRADLIGQGAGRAQEHQAPAGDAGAHHVEHVAGHPAERR